MTLIINNVIVIYLIGSSIIYGLSSGIYGIRFIYVLILFIRFITQGFRIRT